MQLKSQEEGHVCSAYEELAESFEELRAESEAREAGFLEQINHWRREVDVKHAQYEEAHSQVLQPDELEKLRKHIVEEIEVPTRVLVQELQCEMDEAVSVYAKAVADLDALRTHHHVEVARLLQENEYQKIEHAKEIDTLRSELNIYEENLRLKSEEAAALKANVTKHLHISFQNRTLASDNQVQRELRAQAVSVAERAEQELRSRTIQNDQLERRVKILEEDSEEKESRAMRLRAALEVSEEQKANLIRLLAKQQTRRTVKMKQAVSEASQKFTELESHFLVEREEAAKNRHSMVMRIQTHEEALDKIQESCVAEIQAAKKSAHLAETRRLNVEIKLDAALMDLAACKADLLRATAEAEALRESVARLDREYSCEVPLLKNALEQSRAVRKSFSRASFKFF
jgi:hypothetical protein